MPVNIIIAVIYQYTHTNALSHSLSCAFGVRLTFTIELNYIFEWPLTINAALSSLKLYSVFIDRLLELRWSIVCLWRFFFIIYLLLASIQYILYQLILTVREMIAKLFLSFALFSSTIILGTMMSTTLHRIHLLSWASITNYSIKFLCKFGIQLNFSVHHLKCDGMKWFDQSQYQWTATKPSR